MSAISLRELASQLDVSHATVSEALRGSPRVKHSTRLRILAAAERLGYRRNPLASALMTEMRRSRNATFRGSLALLNPELSLRRPCAFDRYQANLVAGVTKRADELGFKINEISVKQSGFNLEKLPDVLAARGIRGVFILPACAPLDLTALDRASLASIRADCATDTPGIDSVFPDYHHALALALDKLHALGYIRPGLLLDADLGVHQIRRWEAAYHAALPRRADASHLEPLISRARYTPAMAAWLEAGKYDVVLATDSALIDALRSHHSPSGETPAFCRLSLSAGETPCAGLDLRPEAIGRRGVELLIDQILRPDCGMADIAITSLIPPAWITDDTLHARRTLLCA